MNLILNSKVFSDDQLVLVDFSFGNASALFAAKSIVKADFRLNKVVLQFKLSNFRND